MAPVVKFYQLPKVIAADPELLPSDKLVYAVILDAGDRQMSVIGIRRIMQAAGLASATVQRSIANLERVGLFSVKRGRNGQRQRFEFAVSVHENDTVSVRKTDTVPKSKLYQKRARSRLKTDTEAYQNPAHVETDLTKDAAPRGAHQQLIGHFIERWAERFGGKYPFDRQKDPPAAQRLLEAVGGDLDRAKAVVNDFLDRGDPWVRDRGSTLALLASKGQLSRLLVRTAPPPSPATAPSDHPVIEAARQRWPEAVEAEPGYWADLARRADDPRSGATTVGLQRLILRSPSVERFKAAVPTPRRWVAGA